MRDNGPGIPEEIRDRLFDPFVSGRAGGSGLGLAIVQRAVEAHRGLVLVESGPGTGTTFTIFLPARDAGGGRRMSQKPSVLVVDDESGILDTLRILLRNEGFEVTTAQGGKAGLEQIRSGAHDLILSDVRMPQVSGLDILNAAREQDPMTPVILMTAQASLQSAISAVNSGAFYYIQKPFSNDELVAILRRACEFRAVRVENKQLKQEIRRRDKTAVARPIGKSKRFMELLKLAEHVAPTESTVLIQGESGTGKEVVARYIHNLSTRADGPVPLHQLRRAAGEPAGERAVRAREGVVHRRGAGQAGALRRGAGRQLLPRRGRRDAARRSR